MASGTINKTSPTRINLSHATDYYAILIVEGNIATLYFCLRVAKPQASVIFTIPEGYRPSSMRSGYCYGKGSVNTWFPYQCSVKSNGEVAIYSNTVENVEVGPFIIIWELP